MLAILKANVAATLLGALSAILLAICVYQYVQLNGFLWIDGVKDDLADCERDRNELRAAAKEAERLNKEQVDRIVADQEKVNDDIEARYRADRERLQRELADSLRRKAAPGSTGSPKAGSDGAAPQGIDAPATVCIPSADYVRGAETELQLDTLITWIEEQLKVAR